MACRLVGAKPLSETMLDYCQLDAYEQTSVKFDLKFIHFQTRKCIWKCRLKNGGDFAPADNIVPNFYSLASGQCEGNSKNVFFIIRIISYCWYNHIHISLYKVIIPIAIVSTSIEIDLRWWANIGSRKAMAWAFTDGDLCRHTASLGHNELNLLISPNLISSPLPRYTSPHPPISYHMPSYLIPSLTRNHISPSILLRPAVLSRLVSSRPILSYLIDIQGALFAHTFENPWFVTISHR